jgi:hypothetical protein
MRGHICDRCGTPYLNSNPNHTSWLCDPCFLGAMKPIDRRRYLETGKRI